MNDPHGWLGQWMEYGRATMMAPPEFILGAGIAALSSTVGSQVRIQLGARAWTSHVWICALGPAGTNKSTPVWRAESAVLAARGSEAMLPRRWSPEGFYRTLKDAPDGWWNVGEVASFLRTSGRDYMAGAREDLCDVWDGARIERARAKKEDSIIVERPAPSAFATGRHSDFTEAAGLSDFRSGFLSRWILMWAQERGEYRGLVKQSDIDTRADAEGEKAWQEVVAGLRAIGRAVRPRVLDARLSDDAIDLWNALDQEWQGEEVPDELSGFSKRRGIQALKLSILHSISRAHPTTGAVNVIKKDVTWGLDFIDRSWEQLRSFSLDVVGADKWATRSNRILERGKELRAGHVGTVSVRDWLRAVQPLGVKVRELDELLSTWDEAGLISIERIKQDGPGRPKRVVTFT